MSAERYRTRVSDGVFEIETDCKWLEIGEMDDIIALAGGPEYTIDYDEKAVTVPWVGVDDERQLTFDVHETLLDVTFGPEFVNAIEDAPYEPKTDGLPIRTEVFVDVMIRIWDSKGNIGDVVESGDYQS